MLRRPGSGVRSGMFNFGLLSLAVTSAAVLTATPATSETLLARRPLSAYPKAICNDATTASYYFANATSGSKDFVLYLQGGGWCYDASSCAKRKTLAPFLTSSKFQLPEHVGKGILSNKEEETPLFAAAKAYVAYCTSDAHMGAREEVDPSSGFFFRGAEVLKAVVSDLVVREGLGSSPNQRVFFGGSSAGGRGAMASLDLLPGMIKEAWKGLQDLDAKSFNPPAVFGVLDSPLWIDIPPFATADGLPQPFANETKQVFVNANASGRVSPACSAVFTDKDDQWKCIFGQYRLPAMPKTSPFIVYASQDDSFQMDHNKCEDPLPTESGEAEAYARDFGRRTKEIAENLADAGFAVYSSACYNHAVSETETFFTEKVAGSTMAEALHSFIEAQAQTETRAEARAHVGEAEIARYGPNTLVWIENCQGWKCGANCKL